MTEQIIIYATLISAVMIIITAVHLIIEYIDKEEDEKDDPVA